MNELIKAQLRLCQKAKVPELSGNETKIYIPKGAILLPEFVSIGGYYIIKLSQYVVDPPEGFTLHANWNNGIGPKEQTMQCVVENVLGKMVRINGIGFDIINSCYIEGTEWQGWVPQKSITIIKHLG